MAKARQLPQADAAHALAHLEREHGQARRELQSLGDAPTSATTDTVARSKGGKRVLQ